MAAASFLRNGRRCYHHSLQTLSKRHSIADILDSPILRSQQQHQQSNAYARFSNSIFSRRARGFGLSPPTILSSPISSTPSSSSSSSSTVGFVGWYLGMVKSRPILTKSITCGLVYMAADLSSQTIVQACSNSYDLVRTSRMAGYGLLLVGPTLHLWFNFLSKALPKRDIVTTMIKILMAQAIYGPTLTASFFSLNAALQGENGSEIIARLERDLIPTMISGVMYWPFCDFVTYKFIPVHLQPLVSNSFSYLWTVYLTYMASLEKAGTN